MYVERGPGQQEAGAGRRVVLQAQVDRLSLHAARPVNKHIQRAVEFILTEINVALICFMIYMYVLFKVTVFKN